MKIIIGLRSKEEDGSVNDIYFYGEEQAPLEISALYWAVRQGGWEEPEEAHRDTLEKMRANLTHLGEAKAVPEEYGYSMAFIIDYHKEEVTIIGNTRNNKIGMADWVDVMSEYFEDNLGNGSLHDAYIWIHGYPTMVY